MKIKLLIVALAGIALPLLAAPLTESTFTEIVRDVNVVAAATSSATPAQPEELLQSPDRVRTGANSRAELTAPDKTITRLGANTVFSFAGGGRTLNLEQGNILFHAPHGLGGGTIKSGGAVAAVLGTTLIVSAGADGGFKVILLEGKGRVTLANRKNAMLKGGQMVFVLAGGTKFSPVLDINLGKLVGGSALVNGFSHPLPSLPLIQKNIARQNSTLAAGGAVDIGNSINGFSAIDPGSYQTAAHPTLTGVQFETDNPQTPGFVIGQNGSGGRSLSPR